VKELLVRVIGKKRDGHGRMKQEGRTKKWTMEVEAAVSNPRKVGATMFFAADTAATIPAQRQFIIVVYTCIMGGTLTNTPVKSIKG